MATLEKFARKPAISIDGDATVEEAIDLMAIHGIGAIVVMEEEEISGIFSERDLINRVMAKKLSPKKITVSQVMTFPVKTAPECLPTEEGLREMYFGDFRHLPITDLEGKLVGMVTIKDLLLHQLNELSLENGLSHFSQASLE